MRLAAVVLTMGNRPAELAELIATVAKQQGDPIDVVVVGNGVRASELPDLGDVRTVDLPENLGIPGGRNHGYRVLLELPPEQRPEVILTLDDDGALERRPGRRDAAHRVRRRPAPGHRLVPDHRPGHRRRPAPPRAPGTRRRPGPLLGGHHLPRRRERGAHRGARAGVGVLPGEFFLFHEETDLAWRALDAGWTIEYRADLTLHHPTTSPTRHATYHRLVARNRVWLAKRNLPWPLVPLYLGTWFGLTLLRTRDAAALRAWLRGFAEGVRTDAGPRQPMRWRTVWRMARLGRPPII